MSDLADLAASVHAADPRLQLRPESADDHGFAEALIGACSPLAGVLPPAMIEQQAAFQIAGHRAQHPQAEAMIIAIAGMPCGRLVIDPSTASIGGAHLVDIAVHPEWQGQGIGRAVLAAWCAQADATGLRLTLEVLADNPARELYARLGFVELAGDDPASPALSMERRPAKAGAAA